MDKVGSTSDDLSRRQFAAVTTAAVAAAGAAAAEAAPMQMEMVIKTADGDCDVALTHPVGKGKWPAVLVWPDAFGLRPVFREMAQRLSAEGASIAVLDINTESAAQICAKVASAGGRVKAYHVDVTLRAAVADAIKSIESEFGTIDILVNNAGLAYRAAFLDLADAEWDRMIALNLTGCFIVAQEVARVMVRHGGGKIVNVAATAAHMAFDHQAAYSAAKGGLVALTHVMAFELAPKGISVNAVSPGPVETAMSAKNMPASTLRPYVERIPQGRLAQASELAAAIAFLVSPDASYINGTTLDVDAGLRTAGIRE